MRAEFTPMITAEDRAMAEIPTLTDAVVALMKNHGWLVFRVRQGRPAWNLGSGFPDLCAAREATSTEPGRILFAELKREGAPLDPKQEDWIAALGSAVTPGGRVDVFVWRPSDLRLGHIEQALT